MAPAWLTSLEVHRTIVAHADRLRDCYDRRLTYHPHLEGHLAISFDVRGDGATANVHDDGSTLGVAVVQCSLEVVADLKFPAPRRGVVPVTYAAGFTVPRAP